MITFDQLVAENSKDQKTTFKPKKTSDLPGRAVSVLLFIKIIVYQICRCWIITLCLC